MKKRIKAKRGPKPVKKRVQRQSGGNELAIERQSAVSLPPQPPSLLAACMQAITDTGTPPDKMTAVLAARDRLMREQAEVQYRRAYRAAKLSMPRITKDGKIDEGTTRSGRQGKKARYATYENINEVIAPILRDADLDLSLHSEPAPEGGGLLMRATLSYIGKTEYGEIVYSESSVVPMPPDPSGGKNTAQAISSALSYAKRIAVMLVLNLISYAPEDRDRDGYQEKPAPPKPSETQRQTSDGTVTHSESPSSGAMTQGESEPVHVDEGELTIDMEEARNLAKEIADNKVPMEKFKAKFGEPSQLPKRQLQDALEACRNYGRQIGGAAAA